MTNAMRVVSILGGYGIFGGRIADPVVEGIPAPAVTRTRSGEHGMRKGSPVWDHALTARRAVVVDRAVGLAPERDEARVLGALDLDLGDRHPGRADPEARPVDVGLGLELVAEGPVVRALGEGWSWARIAEALDISRQAVQKKHGHRIKSAR